MHNHDFFGFFHLATPLLVALFVVPNASTARPTGYLAHVTTQDVSIPAVPRGKKLVMKDGSFQIVTSYQVLGARVRYFSAERSDWEEIPTSLVDWPATKQAEAEAKQADTALTSKLKADEETTRTMPIDVDASFEVVPGVFLPPGEGFFILDGKAIFPLKQSAASTKLSKGHFIEQIVVPLPVIPSRTNVTLPGRHAAFRIGNPTPEFYLRTSDFTEPQIELIVAHVQGDKRHIENIDTLFGQHAHKGKTILLQEWPVAKGLYRFTLGQSLAPGEYALAQFSSKEGLNLLLWDFGVDPPRTQATKRK